LVEATGEKMAIGRDTGSDEAELLLVIGQKLRFGAFVIKALSTPGHTQGCMSFLVNGMLFSSDTLFIRSRGRTDFQQGDSKMLFQSIIVKLFQLPPETLVYPGHDYNVIMVSSIGEELRWNTRVRNGTCDRILLKKWNSFTVPAQETFLRIASLNSNLLPR